MNYHNPILLHQAIDGLNIREGGVYLDMTFGGGGYSNEILNRAKKIKVIAFDIDKDALQNQPNDKRLTLIHSNFRFFDHFLEYLKIDKVNGIVADLGVSSHQFDSPERGFSFRFNESLLDFRMNKESKLTAATIINEYDEEQLKHIFYHYGNIKNASKLTHLVIKSRQNKRINSVGDFITAINSILPKGKEHKYLAKVFQALRIVVNDELESLKKMLLKAANWIITNGRLSIVSYHSLEDRIVKNYFKTGNFEGIIEKDFKGNIIPGHFVQIHKKAIVPDEREIKHNNRARSAKLRIAEKL